MIFQRQIFIFSFFSLWRPNYANPIFWFNSKPALLLFFLGPILIIVSINTFIVLKTLLAIKKAAQEAKDLGSIPTRDMALIYVRLSAIGGVTWLFALIYQLLPVAPIGFLFLIFNSSQGLLVALSFLFTRNVRRHMRRIICKDNETSYRSTVKTFQSESSHTKTTSFSTSSSCKTREPNKAATALHNET